MERLRMLWEKWGYLCVLTACIALIAVTAVLTRPRGEGSVTAPEVTRYAQATPAPKPVAAQPAAQATPQPVRWLMPAAGQIGMPYSPDAAVYNETLGEYAAHAGMDILTDEGEPVRACGDGTVTRVWEDALMGYCIEVTHRGGYVSAYASLYSPGVVEEGTAVSRGQVIGTAGTSACTECAAGPHVHVELRRLSQKLDPAEFFEETLQ